MCRGQDNLQVSVLSTMWVLRPELKSAVGLVKSSILLLDYLLVHDSVLTLSSKFLNQRRTSVMYLGVNSFSM